MKSQKLIAMLALVAAGPAAADAVSDVQLWRTADCLELEISARADVGAIRDLVTIEVNGEPVVTELRIGAARAQSSGRGEYQGISVTATCSLTAPIEGTMVAGHDCTVTVAGEKAARLIF